MEEILKEISDSLKLLHTRMDGIEERLEHLEKENATKESINELLKITKEGNEKEEELIKAGLEAILEIAEMLGNAVKMISRLPKKIMAEAIEDIDYDDTDKWNIEHPDDPKKFGRIEKYIDPKTGEVKNKIKSYTLREAISRIYDMSKFLEKANKDLIEVAQIQKIEEGTQYQTNLEILQNLELIIAKQLGKNITPEYNFEQELGNLYDLRLQESKRVMKNRAINTIREIRKDAKKDVYERMEVDKTFLLSEDSKGYRKAYSEEVKENENKKIENLQKRNSTKG